MKENVKEGALSLIRNEYTNIITVKSAFYIVFSNFKTNYYPNLALTKYYFYKNQLYKLLKIDSYVKSIKYNKDTLL